RSLLKLCEQLVANGQAGSESRGRREKVATIEQTAPPDGRKASCYDCGGKLARPLLRLYELGTRLRRRISFGERLEAQCFSHQNFGEAMPRLLLLVIIARLGLGFASAADSSIAGAIDTEKSVITVRVFKAGFFSAFAHDHEISAPIEQGGFNEGNTSVEVKVDAR